MNETPTQHPIATPPGLSECFRFEELLGDFMARFVHVPAERVDQEIHDAQRQFCQFLSLDRSSLWQFSPVEPSEAVLTHFCSLETDWPLLPSMMKVNDYLPWAASQALHGKTVAVTNITSLPPQAARDRETWHHYGTKSILIIPLSTTDGSVVGALTMDAVRGERDWPDRVVTRCRLLSQIFANALVRKRSEEALRASEARFRAIVETSHDEVLFLDENNITLYQSPSHRAIAGYAAEERVGRDALDIVHPDDLAAIRQVRAEALSHPQTHHELQFRIRHKDGSWRWIEASIRDLLENPEVRAMVVSIRDITDRKRAEQERSELLAREQKARAEAEAANRAKDQFLAVVSHELRTPLTPVVAAVGLLLRDSRLPQERVPLLNTIRRNIELEARLVSDLLDLTRVSQGQMRLEKQRVDVHGLVREVLETFKGDMEAKQLHLSIDLHAREHHLHADPARLQQVFCGLLSNAVKFTPPGGWITVNSFNDGGMLRVEVRDTGIGMEPEVMPRLFKPFEQGEQTLTRHYGGLGLGLSISKVLTELHGGTIEAHSEGYGKGAVFTVGLPVTPSVARAAAQPVAPEVRAQAMKILVVEDNEDTLQVLAQLLRSMGHEVRTARSAGEALQAASDGSFDLIISDIGLPDTTGWELMRQIRARKPVTGIAFSGFGASEDVQKSREVGFMDHLVKPINVQRLEQVIAEAREHAACA